MVGTTIGQYKVIERLGEGGMGVVYKARDTKLDRTVAIKVLPPELVADAGRNARFVQEAKAASALNHPNIVTIHDVVSHQAGECLVMEYVEGKPLSLLIAEREMRLAEVLKIAAQIADAIAAAHTAGIIHRDLKPANVMVTPGGLVKVLDFGLAKLVSGSGSSPGATMTMPRTDPGTVVGTPGYMSPEQVRGLEVDRRTDIFNFGLVLYEMLAGARAFQGETTADVASAILKESPPDLPDTVPAALRQIVAVCLEKNPINRFESARDIGHALRALSAGTSLTGAMAKVEEVASKGFLRRRWPLVLAAATSVAAIAFAALFFLRRPDAMDLSAYKYTPFAMDAEPETFGAWAPDGKSIAYLKQVGTRNQLFVRGLNTPVPTQLTKASVDGSGPEVYGRPFWSPKGDKIYFLAGGKVWSIGVAGGEPQIVFPSVHAAADISPDGNTLVVWRVADEGDKKVSSLWISSPPGSAPRRYEPSPFEFFGQSSPVFLRFSPDGAKIGLSYPPGDEGAPFWLLDWPDGPKAKPARRFLRERNFRWPPAFDWLPDSRSVVMAVDGALWLGDTETGALRQMTSSEAGGQNHPSVSPDGRRIVYTAAKLDRDIVEIPLDGSGLRPFLATSRNEFSPSWTQAGDKMAFGTNRAGKDEIWLRSRGGDWERPVVTSSDFPDGTENYSLWNVALSPDGGRVAFTRAGPEGNKVWVASASGGKAMLAFPQDKTTLTPSWSPDGNRLAVLVYPVLAVGRAGSNEAPVLLQSHQPSTNPLWSPDGRWIAYGNAQELVFVSPDGRTVRKIPSPIKPWYQNFVMVWSRDSSTIYMASSQSETARLYSVDIKTEKARTIADLGKGIEFRSGLSFTLTGCLSPDGKSLFTTVRVNKSDLWILEGFPQPKR